MRDDLRQRNKRLLTWLMTLVVGMVGLAYASVPLYSLFCRMTGYGGTTRVATQAPDTTSERMVTVRFNADVAPQLPWRFRPDDQAVALRLGQQGMTSFSATNRGQSPTVGTATFNVTPDKAGKYFNKIACFCFEEQVLTTGASATMPVVFYVDPALESDPDMADVKTITLSYTFFRAKDEAAVLAKVAAVTTTNPVPVN